LRIALSHIKDRELIHLCFIKTLQKRHERAETERDEKGSFNQEYSQVYMDFWLLVAKTLLHEHRKELISQEYGSEELEKLGPLHLSAGRGDHEIVSEIIETINSLPTTSFSTGFKEQALLSKDDSEKTALVLAIKSLSVKCVQHLLTSCKGLASEAHGSDYKYPLYDLIISVLRKPKLIQDACSILEALVLADPKNTLTAPRSQNGGLKGKTPLVLLQENLDSLRARKKNRNGPVQRISNQINSLAVLQTRMERLAYDNLRGSELQLALHGTSGSCLLYLLYMDNH
jgi:hypothetical protein